MVNVAVGMLCACKKKITEEKLQYLRFSNIMCKILLLIYASLQSTCTHVYIIYVWGVHAFT